MATEEPLTENPYALARQGRTDSYSGENTWRFVDEPLAHALTVRPAPSHDESTLVGEATRKFGLCAHVVLYWALRACGCRSVRIVRREGGRVTFEATINEM